MTYYNKKYYSTDEEDSESSYGLSDGSTTDTDDNAYHVLEAIRKRDNPGVDLSKLRVATLQKYKQHFKITTKPMKKKPLAKLLQHHFDGLKVSEGEVIANFIQKTARAKDYESGNTDCPSSPETISSS